VFVQDVMGDGDDATSDAIIVFGANGAEVGQLVQVTGLVTEFVPGGTRTGNQPTTEIVNPSYTVIASNQELPAVIEIGARGRLLPTSTHSDSIYFWESLEAMRVKLVRPTAVSATYRGDTFVRAADQVTSISERGTLNIGPTDFNPERILIAGAGVSVDVGVVLEDVIDVVSYGFGEYKIIFSELSFVKEPSTLVPTRTTLSKKDSSLLIGSYNVLNLDISDNTATGRFALIARHIISNMGGPDIVALQEVQDNDGSTNSAITTASDVLQTLTDEI